MNQYDLTIPTGSTYTKVFTINQNGLPLDLTGYTATIYIIKSPGVLSAISFSTTSGHIVNGLVAGTLTLTLSPADIATIDGTFYKLEIVTGAVQTEILTGNLFLIPELKSGVSYLIPILRLKIGDTNPLSYRYLDEWLEASLVSSIKALARWWNFRYLIDDTTHIVTRNPENYFYIEEEYGVIQHSDEWPIILMANIIIKDGSLQNSAWDVGTWRDAEIYYSNTEGGKLKDASIKRDWEELFMYLKPPTKRLVGAIRGEILEYPWLH